MDKKRTYEFEGSTVDEAIKNALNELGVSRETLIVKVLSEGECGLFGMEGASPAKVKVQIK